MDRVQRFLSDSGKSNHVIALPPDFLGKLTTLLGHTGQILANQYTNNDHIVSEDPVNYPSTTGNVESVSTSPQTALLYAYGINPDMKDKLLSGLSRDLFYDQKPNKRAVIAVIDSKDSFVPNLAPNTSTRSESGRRVGRDDEELSFGDCPLYRGRNRLAGYGPDNVMQGLDDAAEFLTTNYPQILSLTSLGAPPLLAMGNQEQNLLLVG